MTLFVILDASWTDEERAIYAQAMKNADDNVSCLKQKFNEGILIGHEKGRKAEKIEVAKNLLKARVSIDIITQTTGLSAEYIEKIQEKKF